MKFITKNLIALVLLCCTVEALAAPVDNSTAKMAAKNFLGSSQNLSSPATPSLVFTATGIVNGTKTSCFYIFNDSANHSFVIVSADDIIKPVIAYSRETVFGTINMPAGIANQLEKYTKEISYAITNEGQAKTNAAWNALLTGKQPLGKTARSTKIVSPMLKSLWNQFPYYNDLCPYDAASASTTVTGCVATAMAQLMYYWKWPVTGCSSHEYTGTYGTLSANFRATTYMWDSMPASISSPNLAIATLMYHAGIAVDMQYGTATSAGSSSWVIRSQSYSTNCAEFALKSYFRYDPALKGIARKDYSDAAWLKLMTAEINAKRPIIYAGFGSDGGHCFIADGYDTGNYFHFNWGWGGISNGYFTIDDLAPPALGAGGGGGNFDTDEMMLIGVQPAKMPTDTSAIKLNSYIKTSFSPMPYASPFDVAVSIINKGTSTFTGDICARVFDYRDSMVGVISTVSAKTINKGAASVISFSTPAMYAMVAGLYSIRIYYRPAGGTWVPVSNNGNLVNYTTMAVSQDMMIELQDSMIAYGNSALTNTVLIKDGPIYVNADVMNFTTDFSGMLDLSLYDIATGKEVFNINQNRVYLSTGADTKSFFSNAKLDVPAGTYIMYLSSIDDTGATPLPVGSIFYSNPVLVTVKSPLNIPAQTLENSVNIYPNPAKEYITVDLGSITDAKIWLMDMDGRLLQQADANGKNSFTLPLSSISSGVYFIKIQSGENTAVKKVIVTE